MSDFDFKRAIPFVEAIPSGRWTGYKDVAAAADNPSAFHSAGNHMRDSGGRIDNYWRVIHSDGSVPKNFTAPADAGPKDQYAAKQRLVKEGVRFNARGLPIPASISLTSNRYERADDRQRMRLPRSPSATRTPSEVNQRRIAKGQAPLTEVQKAGMLSRLAAERAADSG